MAFETMGNSGVGPYYDTTLTTITLTDLHHYEEYGLKFYSYMEVWFALYLFGNYAIENTWTANFFDTNIR